MKINFNSNNAIIIQFPRYAGGKFISNCLALSRHAVPQDAQSAEYLLENPIDYQYRLKSVLDTLPPPNMMTDWITHYEFGDTQLFGSAHRQWRQGFTDEPNVNPIMAHLTNLNLKFFITCHSGPEELLKLLEVWPNATILMLINHTKFSSISSILKNNSKDIDQYAGNYCKSKYNLLAGPDWPSWEEFEIAKFNADNLIDYPLDIRSEMAQYYKWNLIQPEPIIVDIDNHIFDQTAFLKLIEDLYCTLGFDDFDSDLVGNFWQKYIDLHQIM